MKTRLRELLPTGPRRRLRQWIHAGLYHLQKPRNCRFKVDGKEVWISSSADVDLSRITFGDRLWICNGATINPENGVTFGERVYIGERVQILTHSAHLQVYLYGRQFNALAGKEKVGRICGPVQIDSFTFVGPNSVIMPGTHIGRGSMVNAASYVQGTFPDFSIIGGNPAKRLGDVRDLLKFYLKRHPEVREHYEAWAGTEAK